MVRIPSKRLRWIIGLAAITILFSVYNLYLLDGSWFLEALSRPERRVIKFVSVLVVYAMGVMAFAGRSPAWLLPLWHILYGGLLLLLVLLGLFDTYVSSFSPAWRGLGVSLHLFLISPVPYVFFTIIATAAGRMMYGRQ